MKRALLAAVAAAVVTVPLTPAQADVRVSSVGSTSPAEAKGFVDDDPHLPLSPADAADEAVKFARAKARFDVAVPKQVLSSPDVCPIREPCGRPPAAISLGGRQQPQETPVFCGPAAVSEALSHRAIPLSQKDAARQLKTDASGTAWSGPMVTTSPHTGHPVADVLNNWMSRARLRARYQSVAVGIPTAADIHNLQIRVQSAITDGVPVLNDAVETRKSAFHLTGHPHDRTIQHWFTTYGFSAHGAVIQYEDSARSPHVSWGARVPKYSALSATAIAHIVGTRGYVW